MVELRDGESFALAGLLRNDFQDTVRQFPILGSIPIIGTLFRSTGFQHEETELVIIVTPRLVRPVRAGALEGADRPRRPAQRSRPVPARPHRHRAFRRRRRRSAAAAAAAAAAAGRRSGSGRKRRASQPIGFEKDYGHVL